MLASIDALPAGTEATVVELRDSHVVQKEYLTRAQDEHARLSALLGVMETGILFVPALLFLAAAEVNQQGAFIHAGMLASLLMGGAGVVTTIPLLLFASAAVSEWIGLHALFGAFLAGAVALAYPLVRTSRLTRDGDTIMMQRSNIFFAVIIVLAGIRIGYGFGVRTTLNDESFAVVVDALERLRFDSLWVSERISGAAPDPVVAMSYAAARTKKLKFGMSVMVLPGAGQSIELCSLIGKFLGQRLQLPVIPANFS